MLRSTKSKPPHDETQMRGEIATAPCGKGSSAGWSGLSIHPSTSSGSRKQESSAAEQRRKSNNGLWEIARGVEVPKKVESRKRRGYPYEELEVGESFWVPAGPVKSARDRFRLKNKIHGKRFISRTATENGEVGIRVWRVE